MKRHFMTSLKALCTGVMTLCVASLSLTSCYDDSKLNAKIDELGNEVSALDARLQAVEALTAKLEALTARVDALYTLEFQVTTSNELQYSFDGGKTWISTGIKLAKELECTCEAPEPCTCVEVSLTDNGDSVTIKVGENEFTIKKPEEIVFDIRAGKVYFESEGTINVALKTVGVDDLTVMSAPKGWYAEIASDGTLEVTAPKYEDTVEDNAVAAAEGYVKIHACGANGKCMVGKLPVIVSEHPVSVKAYCDYAYFNAAGKFAPEFYYGASPRSAFAEEVAGLLEDLNGKGWSDCLMNNGEFTVKASLAELLGAEPEAGVEYVVWAIVYEWNKSTYSLEDFIISYYNVVTVTAVEDESLKTAYNVTATVEVKGVDSYYALAIPGNYLEYEGALDEYKENFIYSFEPNSWAGPMGKLYTESYTGSVLDIAEGTTTSMSGNYAPNRDIYILIFPQDGRSWDEYTVEDIYEFKFTTAALVSGGSVNATAKQVFSYMAEVYDYGICDFVEVDKKSQLAVEVKPSSDNWVEFYYQWLDDATYQQLTTDEALVNFLLKEYGMSRNDVEFPYYDCINLNPKTTMHFVAMFVDNAGKYGTLAKLTLATEELVQSEVVFTEPYETNLVDGFLKNTTEFKMKAAVEGGTATSYKYYWLETTYYNSYEGMDEEKMALAIHFDTNNIGVEVSEEELVDGFIVVPNNEYGGSYMVAVLPYENGAPGKYAAIFNFESRFVIDNVATEGTQFDETKPEFTISLPTVMDEFGEGAIYYYSFVEYFKKYQFHYEVNVAITPKEGTTVAASFVDTKNYKLGTTSAQTASMLWQGSFSSYYTYNLTEPELFESFYRPFNHYEDADAPAVYFVISWYDAEGNYYYAEQNLQPELQKLADKMNALLCDDKSIDAKQWVFDWVTMGVPAMLDFGVTSNGKFYLAYDASAYGMEGYVEYLSAEGFAVISSTDGMSGVITLTTYNMYGEAQTMNVNYELTATTCHFICESIGLDSYATVSAEVLPVIPNGVSMPM